MRTEERICGTCLNICDKFKVIQDDMKDVLDVVLPKIDLITGIQEPVSCTNCTEMLMKCFDFKAACLHTHNYIVPFVNKDTEKLDLKDIYLRSNGTGVSEDQDVCRLCMGLVKNSFATSLDGDLMFMKMIKQCLPELDLAIIKKPVICPSCLSSLEHCFRFVTTCLISKEKIEKYRDNLEVNSKGQIELSSLLQFTVNDTIKCEVGDITVDEIKNEDDSFVLEQMFHEEGNGEIEERKFLVKEEIKTDDQDFNSFQDTPTSSQSITENINMYNTKDHVVAYQDVSEVRVKNLDSMAEIKSAHDYHNPSGVTVYRCRGCPFITELEVSLKVHLLTHQEFSEVTKYRCESCSYVAKRKGDLKSHMVMHQDVSEVIVYKCESCPFVTKHRSSLRTHMLLHRELSEGTVYTCDRCTFVTRHERSLRRHMLTHRELSEITVYRCESCSYVAKRKGNLKAHMLTHLKLSEVTVYRCNICSFETKHKGSLKGHILTHRELSKVTAYKCKNCSHVTRRKRDLKNHMLVHQELSEVTVYSCDSCKFVTKHETSLKRHMLIHRDLSEVTVYLCDRCSFSTKRAGSLKRHVLTHQEWSEISKSKKVKN